MKIRNKLMIAFIIPTILISILSLVGLGLTKHFFYNFANNSSVKIHIISDINTLENSLSKNTFMYLLLQIPEEKINFEENVIKINQLFIQYKKFPMGNEEQAYLLKVEVLVNRSILIKRELFQAIQMQRENSFLISNLFNTKFAPILMDEWKKQLLTSDPQFQEKQAAILEIAIKVNNVMAASRGYLLYAKPEFRQEMSNNLEALDTWVKNLSQLNLTKQELFWMNQLQTSATQLDKLENDNMNNAERKINLLKETEQLNQQLNIDYTRLEKIAFAEENYYGIIINKINYITIAYIFIFLAIGFILSWIFSRYLVRPIEQLKLFITKIRSGEDIQIKRLSNDEVGDLSETFGYLVNENKVHTAEISAQNWLKDQTATILKIAQAESELERMCSVVVTKIAEAVHAGCAAFFITTEDEKHGHYLTLHGSYAYKKRKHLANKFQFGEGLIGQAALEGKSILLTNVPDDYIHITSSLGDQSPNCIMVLPLQVENKVLGVIEIALFHPPTDIQQQFFDLLSINLGVVIEAIQNRQQTENALKRVQEQSQELQTQQEELRTTNEELEEKTRTLQESEEELKAQSEELQQTNEELEEKMIAIERQKSEIEKKNKEVEAASRAVAEKAEALARAGKYKTEFLSNMSHELRTPLNSLLLLSKTFANNDDGNLTPDQIEQAGIIYKGGKDLLEIINDILDLSKVEAGKLNIQIEETNIEANIIEDLQRQFNPVANKKGIRFEVEVNPQIKTINTDAHRLKQILRNLISNAIKFTEKGFVKLHIDYPSDQVVFRLNHLNKNNCMVFAVIDSGIGIAKEKHQDIFEAFQQAYGDTDRIYGGTGLGLTISRELTSLLGGEIQLTSHLGSGSTFSLYLPIEREVENKISVTPTVAIRKNTSTSTPLLSLADDQNQIHEKDKIILIIDDDKDFNQIVMQLAHKKGYKCLTALNGVTALTLATQYKLDGIILDLGLPDMDGTQVLEKLKENSTTKNIPIHIISGKDQSSLPIQFKTIDFLTKPVSAEELNHLFENFLNVHAENNNIILLIDGDPNAAQKIETEVKAKNIDIVSVTTAAEALHQLKTTTFNGVILDINLPDISALDFLKTCHEKNISLPPVIIYSGRNLSEEEYVKLNQYTDKIVRKDESYSLQRLLNECSLFLHAILEDKTPKQREVAKILHNTDKVLQKKTVLLVDDDMRNVYALSVVLQRQGMQVVVAVSGEDAMKKLEEMQAKAPDIVLMDIMMPGMDGYETMKKIRSQKQYKDLPMIAVTAKVMPEDKKACIDAGANDYVTKPIDDEKLLSLLRIWLSK